MTLRVGINGVGWIGRLVARAVFEEKRSDIEIVAINDPGDYTTTSVQSSKKRKQDADRFFVVKTDAEMEQLGKRRYKYFILLHHTLFFYYFHM